MVSSRSWTDEEKHTDKKAFMDACFWLTLNYHNKNHVRNKSEVDAYGWIMPPVSG